MDLFVGKLVFALFSPVGAGLCLITGALVLSGQRFRTLFRAMLAITLAGLWTASTPVFANWLCNRLEREYPPSLVRDYPQADVVVLLGGVLAQPLPPRVDPDIGPAADRVVLAWRLYRDGKAPRILISGGNLPWSTAVAPEAELIADLLVELGVPRSALVLEGESRNTRENGQNAATIFSARQWRSGLLVTSGLHMPRAKAVFRKLGIPITPAATDIRARFPAADSALDFLPDADALALTTSGIKELFGGLVYRVRGWA